MSNNKLIGLSLFACGGISEYYLDETNVDIKVANELVQKRADFYQEMYPDSKMICGDITDKDVYKKVLKEAKRVKVDFIMSTSPCQGLSRCGQMKFDDPRNALFLSTIKFIKILKPKYVLIENVPEFLKGKYINENNEEEKIVNRIDRELKNLYNICGKVLNAKDYGVPQSRNRAIMLLSRKDLKKWEHPDGLNTEITVRETIGDLPSLKSEQKLDPTKYDLTKKVNRNLVDWHFAKKHNENHILWMSNTPTGKSAFDNEVNYPQKDGRRIRGFKTTYKRVEWDKPCPTITMSNGSISSQNNVHPGRYNKKTKLWSDARAMSVYELLLLTSLPKDIVLPKDATEKLMRDLIGECVPSKFMLNLIKSLPEQMNKDLKKCKEKKESKVKIKSNVINL